MRDSYEDNGDSGTTEWLSFIWLNRSFILKVSAVFLLAGIITAFVIPPKYSSVATILPRQSASGAASLLAKYSGIIGEIPLDENIPEVKLYPAIAVSRNVLERALESWFGEGTFYDIFSRKYSAGRKDSLKLIHILCKKMIRTNLDYKTNLLSITVTTYNPELSAAFANEILTQMESFFQHQLTSATTRQLEMIEKRLIVVSDSLKSTENNLLQFRESNRSTLLSPNLQIKELRLLREVEINSTLYIELNRQLELAKIGEVKQKPVLNVLDRAVAPLKKSSPSRLKILMYFFTAGFLSAVLFKKNGIKTRRIIGSKAEIPGKKVTE